jgi:HK97 family phage prohead protease
MGDTNPEIPVDRQVNGPVQKVTRGETAQIDIGERTLIAVVSDDSVDRYGDIIEAAGWDLENFKKNPVIPWAHATGGFFTAAELPVGKAEDVWVEGNKLYAKIKFAEHAKAEDVWQLYKDGFLRAFSVGFLPKKYEAMYEGEGREAHFIGYKFQESELLEISAVPVPANPNALALAMHKGLRLEHIGKDLPELPKIIIPEVRTVVGNGEPAPVVASAPPLEELLKAPDDHDHTLDINPHPATSPPLIPEVKTEKAASDEAVFDSHDDAPEPVKPTPKPRGISRKTLLLAAAFAVYGRTEER